MNYNLLAGSTAISERNEQWINTMNHNDRLQQPCKYDYNNDDNIYFILH